MTPLCRLAICLCFGFATLEAARADIYVYTEGDEAIVLSNLRSVGRGKILIREGNQQATEEWALAPSSRAAGVQYQQAVMDVAKMVGIDSALLSAVIAVESGYSARAVSSKGATGLMQLMPATAKRYGVVDLFDASQNLRGGAQYLRDMLDLFAGDIGLALAAYNAGENAVLRAGRRIPPYAETRNYVQRVRALYSEYKAQQARNDTVP